jgi:hypothetical protein
MTQFPKLSPGAQYLHWKENLPQRVTRASKMTPNPPLSIAEFARKHGYSVKKMYKDLERIRAKPPKRVKNGRPGALTKEEIALIAFIQHLQPTGFPAQKETVVAAANQILQSRDPQALELSSTWYSRFKTRHPEVTKTTVRSLEVSRHSCEASGEKHIETFFENHRNAVNSHNIGASECWNEDETGIRQGVMSGKLEVLVILGDRKERPTLVNPNNRELASLVDCANAAGIAIPPFVIFKSWPTEAWQKSKPMRLFASLEVKLASPTLIFTLNGFITLIFIRGRLLLKPND